MKLEPYVIPNTKINSRWIKHKCERQKPETFQRGEKKKKSIFNTMQEYFINQKTGSTNQEVKG